MREVLQTIGQNASNAGLVLARYLPYAQNDSEKPQCKESVYRYARQAVGNSKTVYKQAFERWQTALKQHADIREFTVDGRMIIGLGSANVLEAGITLQQTYGVPYIPGCALKGLTSHYAVENNIDAEVRKQIFGEQDFAGMVQFHDAWIHPDNVVDCLVQDVMTPHHTSYYEGKENEPPSEFESPVPVPFLSAQGTFYVALSCDDNSEQGKQWLKFVWALLENALSEKGIGGKTNSGYGYGTLKEPPPPPPPPKKEYQAGELVEVTRLTKKEAQSHGKDLLFKDQDGNLCIVKKDNEKAAKEKTSNNPKIELVFVSKQTQNGKEFYQFRLPD